MNRLIEWLFGKRCEPVNEPECNCTLRGQLLGDGCDVCNPEFAKRFEEENQDEES